MTQQTNSRFNNDIHSNDPTAVTRYFIERARQIQHKGYRLAYVGPLSDGGLHFGKFALWVDADAVSFISPYIFADHRGGGLYLQICEQLGVPVLTHTDCGLAGCLRSKNIPHTCLVNTVAYDLVQSYFAGKSARKTEAPYMRHIDEGLTILATYVGHTDCVTQAAYCVHPIYQDNNIELIQQFEQFAGPDSDVVRLAKRYSIVANSFLTTDLGTGKQPPAILMGREATYLDESLRDLLVADKIQNCKEFEANKNRFSEERQAQLQDYFAQWLLALGVTRQEYLVEVEGLQINPLGL